MLDFVISLWPGILIVVWGFGFTWAKSRWVKEMRLLEGRRFVATEHVLNLWALAVSGSPATPETMFEAEETRRLADEAIKKHLAKLD